jgi:mRNA interferase RelE/StbE
MKVVLTEDAERDLAGLDRKTAGRIVSRLKWFAEHFDEQAPQPLSGALRGYHKLRVGDWRVIYEINRNDRMLTVHAIEHRSEIYRRY